MQTTVKSSCKQGKKSSHKAKDNINLHLPVLVEEIIGFLDLKEGQVIIDGTVGLGGHARAILSHPNNIRLLVGLDVDPQALEIAGKNLEEFGERVRLIRSSYVNIPEVLISEEIDSVDAIILDLGLSSFQLEHSGRGFSFTRDEPLDMRMDPSISVTASDMVNKLPFEQLAQLIRSYGEERWAKKIAKTIVKKRDKNPIISSKQLAEIVSLAIPRKYHPRRIHPATKTFQALRIAVNRELDQIKEALFKLPDCLKEGGKLAIIAFHSLEDRLVKHAFKHDPRLKALTKKPVTASDKEISNNPRARSAKLRVAQRTDYKPEP